MDLSNRSNKRFHDDIVSVLQTVRSVNIPEAAKVDDSCPDDCVLALNHIKSLLTDSGYAREALAIDNALDHCLASKDDGGLGFSLNDTTTETIQEAMLFQVDIWLEALNSEDRTRHLPKGLLNVPPGRRPMTLTEKILVHHSIDPLAVGGPVVGEVLRISVDWVVTSELAWAGLYVGITKAGVKTVFRNDRIWIAGDHRVDPRNYNTPLSQKLMGAANKAERAFKLTENKGANFTIMHTEFVRQKALPGTVVIGADSHTCSSGAVGCLAIGLGVADVAIPVIAGETWFRLPECIKVSFVGNLLPGIGGKDIILHILGQLKRNTVAANRVVEFSGPGLCQLSIDARFAICNMCTELGAITGIFVPDEVTKAYVDNRKAKHGSQSPLFFSPDEDACYAETFEIDLGSIMPFIALYPSPDNVVPVTEALGTKLDGCFIGACTTTEEDLVLAALVLKAGLVKGMPLATGTRHVTPGSLPIVKRLKKLGLLSVYEEAGFSQGAPGCSYCVGVVDVASPGSVWLSSQNRNFQDRMGKGAIGNLASAITVAASSFSMTIADPIPLLLEIDQTVWFNYQSMLPKHEQQSLPGVQLPRYVQPDFVHRSAQSPKQDLNFSLTQGASKKSPIEGKAIVLGDFVDTDALAPSEFLTSATTDQELGEHCMQYAYPEFREKVKKGLNVVVAGKAFGVGSSREQAPRALKGLGVECVVARSFAFIYARNQPNVGLLGIVIDDDAFYSQVTDGAAVDIDMDLCRLCVNGSVYPFRLDNLEYAMIERGGLAAAFAQFGKNMFGKLTAIAEKSRTEKTRSGPKSCEEPAELQW